MLNEIPSGKVAILADLFPLPDEEAALKFRLTYRGSLRASQNPHPTSTGPDRHWNLKHRMRLQFHPQLKRLWETRAFLRDNQNDASPDSYHVQSLASKHVILPWHFVPLVTEQLSLRTKIEITILRVDHPHLNLWSYDGGDVDNRVKTIIDALRVPGARDGYDKITVEDGEDPLFVLTEADELFDAVYAETDHLLVVPDGQDASYAEVIIAVTIWP